MQYFSHYEQSDDKSHGNNDREYSNDNNTGA
jgi:hypothetical protein